MAFIATTTTFWGQTRRDWTKRKIELIIYFCFHIILYSLLPSKYSSAGLSNAAEPR